VARIDDCSDNLDAGCFWCINDCEVKNGKTTDRVLGLSCKTDGVAVRKVRMPDADKTLPPKGG
jgi:hypothetical protein